MNETETEQLLEILPGLAAALDYKRIAEQSNLITGGSINGIHASVLCGMVVYRAVHAKGSMVRLAGIEVTAHTESGVRLVCGDYAGSIAPDGTITTTT